MTQVTTNLNVFEKLALVRVALLSESRTKSGRNEFSKYQYFELSDFLPSVLNEFKTRGLLGIFHVNDGMAYLDVHNTERPEEKVTFSAPFGGCQLKGCHEVQNIGASITYMRRYLWGCAVELIEGDAIDLVTNVNDEAPKPPQKQPKQQDVNVGIPFKEMAEIEQMMKSSTDHEELRYIFGGAWKRANAKQKAKLKSIYDERKPQIDELNSLSAPNQ